MRSGRVWKALSESSAEALGSAAERDDKEATGELGSRNCPVLGIVSLKFPNQLCYEYIPSIFWASSCCLSVKSKRGEMEMVQTPLNFLPVLTVLE